MDRFTIICLIVLLLIILPLLLLGIGQAYYSWRKYLKRVNLRRWITKAHSRDSKALQQLIHDLCDQDDSIRSKAAEALGEIGDTRAAESLINALKDSHAYVIKNAAEALGRIGNIRVLTNALENRNFLVRLAAAEALCKFADEQTVKPLINVLKDESPSVRQASAEVLGKVGDKQAVKSLINLLKDEEPEVRQTTAEALGKVGDTRPIKPLTAALSDNNNNVCSSASIALDKMGWRPSIDEVSSAYWVSRQNWQECIKIDSLTTRPLLLARKTKDESVKHVAADTLIKIGEPLTEPLITSMRNRELDILASILCYSVLEHITGYNLFEAEQLLFEIVAKKIRKLYSQTRAEEALYFYEYGEVEYVSDLDIKGIRRLVALIPSRLLERVRSSSGEARDIF